MKRITEIMTKEQITNRIAELKAIARKFQASQFRSSQMRDAKGVFACERQLENIWREIDALRNGLENGEVLGWTISTETLFAR